MQSNFRSPDFYSHVYNLTHEVKTYNVYTINVTLSSQINLLTDIVRVENYNGKSNAYGIDKYLRLRTSSSWLKSEKVTGLRPTTIKNVFTGDRLINGKKNLLVFIFSNDYKRLRIDVYRSFYPNTPIILQSIIRTNYGQKKEVL